MSKVSFCKYTKVKKTSPTGYPRDILQSSCGILFPAEHLNAYCSGCGKPTTITSRYTHYVSLGFSLESNDLNGEDITAVQVQKVIEHRLKELAENDELFEAIGLCCNPLDTEENEPEWFKPPEWME